jgi:hypothetical protein
MELSKLMRTDLLRNIDEEFPYDMIEQYESRQFERATRDRVYNTSNTLLTMVVCAISEDKSIKQGVSIFKDVFELQGKNLLTSESIRMQQAKEIQQTATGPKKRGRPSLFIPRVPKSKIMEVSDNTAAFSKARARLDKDLVMQLFHYSSDFKELDGRCWHGMSVGITDGTYFQMQDTSELRRKYYVKQGDSAYPQGLLQAIVRQGSGQIVNFNIGTRHQSELELVKPLIQQLPPDYLLLADDFYNSYAIFCFIKRQGCHIIVPGKRDRNYKVIRSLAAGDEIVEISKTKIPSWLSKAEWNELDETVLMRRISYLSPVDGQQEWILYTTLLDESIAKEEIILKYATRWDIEITIREIKTIMGINIARSKREEMVLKEITVALTAYNMIRKIVARSVQTTDFSPQSHFIQECFETDTGLLVDKKGRVYHRWSPGRNGKTAGAN